MAASPNLREMEKVTQNENREAFASNERTKTNETEINNLPDKSKALVMRTLIKLGKGIEEHSENFDKKVENIEEPIRSEECNYNEKHTRTN